MEKSLTTPPGRLQPGSLILVTGANGYLGSHVVDQLLKYGYFVRGTVRDLTRANWMLPFFRDRYPNQSFELALESVRAVIHTAGQHYTSNVEFQDTIMNDDVLELTALMCDIVVKNLGNNGSIQRVVITNCSYTAAYPEPNHKFTIAIDSYDHRAGELLLDAGTPKELRPLLTHSKIKTQTEQMAWKMINDKDIHQDDTKRLVLNTVLSAICFGPVLMPEYQENPSTGGLVRRIYEKKDAVLFSLLAPQWFVDVRDAALLHVGAAVLNGVENERIFAYADKFVWPQVADLVAEVGPNKDVLDLPYIGEDLSEVPPRERAKELLVRLGRDDWVGFQESVRENMQSYLPRVANQNSSPQTSSPLTIRERESTLGA